MNSRILIFTLMLTVLFLSACEKPTEPETFGTVEVQSNPTGASVWINNENSGYSTNCIINSVPTGNITFTLKLDGYEDWSEEIYLTEFMTEYIIAELTVDTTHLGNLIVTSQPAGASILLNNIDTGLITPDTLNETTTGLVNLRLMYPNYFPYDDTLGLSAEQTKEISVELDPAPFYKIAYSTAADTVWVMNLDGFNLIPIATDFSGGRILWSPNGEYLSYTNQEGGITILRADGSPETELPFAPNMRAYDQSWSNSSQIHINGAYCTGIYTYNTETDSLLLFHDSMSQTYDHDPVFSLNDSLVAFVYHAFGTSAWLRLKNADGSNFSTITTSFQTNYDEHTDLSWVASNQLLYRLVYQGLFLVTFTIPPVNTETVVEQVFDEGVGILRVSHDHHYYAISSGGDIMWGLVNVWQNTTLVERPGMFINVYDLAWTPNDNALIYCNTNELNWVSLDGNQYDLVNFSNIGYGKRLSIAPQ